ncbi:MAG: hypothetical protein ACI9DJ_002833 [Algoriphagus sp.]|jgi:hypothetical protein
MKLPYARSKKTQPNLPNMFLMNEQIRQKIIAICNDTIEKKGVKVGLSFYAFF